MRVDGVNLGTPGIEEAIMTGEQIRIAEPVEPEVVIVAMDRKFRASRDGIPRVIPAGTPADFRSVSERSVNVKQKFDRGSSTFDFALSENAEPTILSRIDGSVRRFFSVL
jgi:hypothetical protein